MKFINIIISLIVAFSVSVSAKEKVITTQSGLSYVVLEQGNGMYPSANSFVTVHYKGQLENGFVFDSTINKKPISFSLGRVIPGWTEGLQYMKEGAVYKFTIPPHLGYGRRGTGPIPPNATLTFIIQLISIK